MVLAVLGLLAFFLVVETGDYSPSWCAGFSSPRLLLSRSSGSRAHRLGSPSVARRVLRCQGLNPCRWIPSHRATREAQSAGFLPSHPVVQLPGPVLACSFAKRAICAPLLSGRLPSPRGSEGADCTCHGHRLVSQSPAERRCWVTALSVPG